MLDHPEEYAALKDKEYLGLLPLHKWSADTVRGTILSDIINTIVLLNMQKVLDESGLSVSEVTGNAKSLMCFRKKHGEISIETANKKVKTYLISILRRN